MGSLPTYGTTSHRTWPTRVTYSILFFVLRDDDVANNRRLSATVWYDRGSTSPMSAPAADIAAAEATVSAAAAAAAAAVDAGADAAAVPGHNAVACNGPTSSQPRPPAPSHHPQKNSPAQILTDGQAQSTLYNSPNSLRHGRHAMGTLANTG